MLVFKAGNRDSERSSDLVTQLVSGWAGIWAHMPSASFHPLLLPLWMSRCNFKLKRHQIKLPTFICKPVPLLSSLFIRTLGQKLQDSLGPGSLSRLQGQLLNHVCVHKSLQLCPSLSAVWTVARQAPLSVGILQARIILEWVANTFSRGSSQHSNWTHISYVSWIGRRVLYH